MFLPLEVVFESERYPLWSEELVFAGGLLWWGVAALMDAVPAETLAALLPPSCIL